MSKSWPIASGIAFALSDAGLSPSDVLRRANLPEDLFSRTECQLPSLEYYRLWQAISEHAGEGDIGLRLGSLISVESFDPPLFAALCSRNLNQALERVSRYKRLIAPARLHVDVSPIQTSVEFEWLEKDLIPPPALLDAELSFLLHMARIGTRHAILPTKIVTPSLCAEPASYQNALGSVPILGATLKLVFSSQDGTRPFVRSNVGMWQIFEPELKRRLGELASSATLSDRVKSALLELLPGGQAVSVEAVSDLLSMSPRTLQRRLKGEETTFNNVLGQVRRQLVAHYLYNQKLSNTQISYLLGYEDPNSFYRAFNQWTGSSPDAVRDNSDFSVITQLLLLR